jgi:hypothetical protein
MNTNKQRRDQAFLGAGVIGSIADGTDGVDDKERRRCGSPAGCGGVYLFREEDGEGFFRGEHAAGVVAAFGDDLDGVFSAQFFVDEFAEGFAAG